MDWNGPELGPDTFRGAFCSAQVNSGMFWPIPFGTPIPSGK